MDSDPTTLPRDVVKALLEKKIGAWDKYRISISLVALYHERRQIPLRLLYWLLLLLGVVESERGRSTIIC